MCFSINSANTSHLGSQSGNGEFHSQWSFMGRLLVRILRHFGSITSGSWAVAKPHANTSTPTNSPKQTVFDLSVREMCYETGLQYSQDPDHRHIFNSRNHTSKVISASQRRSASIWQRKMSKLKLVWSCKRLLDEIPILVHHINPICGKAIADLDNFPFPTHLSIVSLRLLNLFRSLHFFLLCPHRCLSCWPARPFAYSFWLYWHNDSHFIHTTWLPFISLNDSPLSLLMYYYICIPFLCNWFYTVTTFIVSLNMNISLVCSLYQLWKVHEHLKVLSILYCISRICSAYLD